MMKFVLLTLTILMLISSVTAGVVPTICADMGTVNVSQVTAETANFTADYSGSLPALVWFAYGGKSNTYPYFSYKYNLTTGSTFTAHEGDGFYSNRTMYVRAVSTCGYGPEVSFKVSNVSIVQNTSFGSTMNTIVFDTADPAPHAGSGYEGVEEEANATGPWDPGYMVEMLPSAYTNSFGSETDTAIAHGVFWGFVMLIMFMVLYLRSENITTPALLGMVIGWSLMSFVPGEFAYVGQALLVVAVGAMAFIIIKGRVR